VERLIYQAVETAGSSAAACLGISSVSSSADTTFFFLEVEPMDAKTPQSAWDKNRFDPLISELLQIRNEMLEIENRFTPKIEGLVGTNRNSARNLLHYLALRRRDIRPLQMALASCGLSSLGRSESRVLGNLDAVLKVASAMTGQEWPAADISGSFSRSKLAKLLRGWRS